MVQNKPNPYARVRQASGEERAPWWERATCWERAVAVYPPHAEIQASTDREIPVLVASRPD